MKTYIEDWLGSRLGIAIDFSPENFGAHMKDGKLLAKLLYSYGAIPLEICNSIQPSKNVEVCYNNLKKIKPWLDYLNLPVKDETLYEIACSQGTSALHLFYSLYITLHDKDILHYLSLQKERSYSDDCTKRPITVNWVPERAVYETSSEYESKIALPLIDKEYMIKWHRDKCNSILEKINCIKRKYGKQTMNATQTQLGPITSGHMTPAKLSKQAAEVKNTEEDIKLFTQKHLTCLPDLSYNQLMELQNQMRDKSPEPTPDFQKAKAFLRFVKEKSKRGLLINDFQEEMQSIIVDDLWKKVRKRQEASFEDTVCRNLLKQSRFEKQMCNKLALMRHQKDILVKNRAMIENTKTACIEKEYESDILQGMEAAAEEEYEIKFERQKMAELHKRMYTEKVKLKYEQRLKEAKSILDKFIDISIRIAECRELYSSEIPRQLMKDIKELFFKDLPIFDIVEDLEELYRVPVCHENIFEEEEAEYGEDGKGMREEFNDENDFLLEGIHEQEMETAENSECGGFGDFDHAKSAEFIRQEILNECDFNDYLFLLGPWTIETLFPGEKDYEIPQTILGHIVHKILECKYPKATAFVPADIKPMQTRAIVQGSSEESAFNMLSELMKLQKIFVVRVDDAINFVLRAYKEELTAMRDVDVAFQEATKATLKGKVGVEESKEPSKKQQLLRKDAPGVASSILHQPPFREVSTQTPRKIPVDDPLLSRNAELGKFAFEAMGMGNPCPDLTLISAIIAYVVSIQDNYDGWVLWNYPVLYSEACKLEYALTGYQLMNIEEEMDTMEGFEEFECRDNCVDPYADEFAAKRVSRLVPKPESNEEKITKAESYFNCFVKLQKKDCDPAGSDIILQSQARDHIKNFYTMQGIFYSFEYSSLTFETIKDIGKVILGKMNGTNQNDEELFTKDSKEIFGPSLLRLNEKYNASKKISFKDQTNIVDSPKKGKNETDFQSETVEEESEEVAPEKSTRDFKKSVDYGSRNPKPGDSDWEWASGVQSEDVQLALANFWENMETTYVEDFKIVFLSLRIHRSKTVKYKVFLKKTLNALMRKEDEKQVVLGEFQRKFNDIDDDLRPDSDIKCELHVRVSELEEVLFQMADNRKKNSDDHRVSLVHDNWAADEMTNLVNLYLRALQLEADRCIDTCQFINDYYQSLQQLIPPDEILQKIYTPTLQIADRKDSTRIITSKSIQKDRLNSLSEINGESNLSRRKTKSGKKETSSCIYCSFDHSEEKTLQGAADELIDIFVNLSLTEDRVTMFHKFYIDTAEELKSSIKDTVEHCISSAKRNISMGALSVGKDKKKISDTKIESGNRTIAEWTASLECELSRFLHRIQCIQMRGILEFNEFLEDLMQTFVSFSEEIGKIYTREMKSIGDCCKVFRCAIEEEIAIAPRLELIIDRFIINQNQLLISSSSVEMASDGPVLADRCEFTIEQLMFIFKKLQHIAPDGEIIRRAFMYILEDFRVLKSEDGVPRLLPDLWVNINPNDLPYLFDQIYQRLEIVTWKDFLIYALNLPFPTEVELLTMRSSFRALDKSNNELVNFRDFMRIELWFESYNTRFDTFEAKEFLFKLFQVNEEYTNYSAFLLAFCKDEDPLIGFIKALTLSSGRKLLVDNYSVSHSEEEEEEAGKLLGEEIASQNTDSISPQERIKRNSAQKCMRYACRCKDESVSDFFQQNGEHLGEIQSLYLESKESSESLSLYDVSCDTVVKVLTASFPALTEICRLLNPRKLYKNLINDTLESLSPDGVNVKVSKLLKNRFIFRILTTTNKFKSVNMQNLVKSLVGNPDESARGSCSQTWS